MVDYFMNTAFIGAMVGVIVMAFVCLEALYEDRSPREVVVYMTIGFFGSILVVILFPLVILFGLLYLVVSAAKNNWKWYKR